MSDDTHIVGSYGYNGWLAGQSYDRVAEHAGIPVLLDCEIEKTAETAKNPGFYPLSAMRLKVPY